MHCSVSYLWPVFSGVLSLVDLSTGVVVPTTCSLTTCLIYLYVFPLSAENRVGMFSLSAENRARSVFAFSGENFLESRLPVDKTAVVRSRNYFQRLREKKGWGCSARIGDLESYSTSKSCCLGGIAAVEGKRIKAPWAVE